MTLQVTDHGKSIYCLQRSNQIFSKNIQKAINLMYVLTLRKGPNLWLLAILQIRFLQFVPLTGYLM